MSARARVKADVEQVEDGVFLAADVDVDREPLVGGRLVERSLVEVRREVPQEVPRGVDEGVHRVRLALGQLATVGALGLLPLLGRVQRVPGRLDVLGQLDGQVLVGDRDVPAVLTVDDGDGGAPVALAGDEPVPQAVGRRRLGGVVVQQPVAGGGARQAVVLAAGGQHSVLGERGLGQVRPAAVDGFDHLFDGEVVFRGEGVVALVVRGHAHDRARAHVV